MKFDPTEPYTSLNEIVEREILGEKKSPFWMSRL